MIDRDARNRVAESLRHLVSGQITNDQFEDAAWIESNDAAIDAVKWQAWLLYSDLHGHKLTGSDAVSKSDRRIVARFILFLHSDLEYEWPRHPFDGGVGVMARLLSYVLSLGVIPRHVDKRWEAAGDFDVWPFIRREDYEEALAEPKLLRGRAA
jgi:hypothetical protein